MASNLAPPINPGGTRPPAPSTWGRSGGGGASRFGGSRVSSLLRPRRPEDMNASPPIPGYPPTHPPGAFDQGTLQPPTGQRGEPLIPAGIGDYFDKNWVDPYAGLYGDMGRMAFQVPQGMTPEQYAALIRSGSASYQGPMRKMGGSNFPGGPSDFENSGTRIGPGLLPSYDRARTMAQLAQQRDAGNLRGLTSVEGQAQNRQLALPPELMAARLRRDSQGGGY